MPSLNVNLNKNTIEQFKSFCSEHGKKYSAAFRETMQKCLDDFPTYEAEIKLRNIQGSRSSRRNSHKNNYVKIVFENVPDEIMKAFDKIVLATNNVASRSAVVDYILSDRLIRYKLNKDNANNSGHSVIPLSEEEAMVLHYHNTNSSQH